MHSQPPPPPPCLLIVTNTKWHPVILTCNTDNPHGHLGPSGPWQLAGGAEPGVLVRLQAREVGAVGVEDPVLVLQAPGMQQALVQHGNPKSPLRCRASEAVSCCTKVHKHNSMCTLASARVAAVTNVLLTCSGCV